MFAWIILFAWISWFAGISFSPLFWLPVLFWLLPVLIVMITGRVLALRLAPKLTLRGQAVLYGVLSAVVSGAGQVARGRFLAGAFLFVVIVLVPVLQGFPFICATAFIDMCFLNPEGYSVPEWYGTYSWLVVLFLYSLYCFPSNFTLWLFGIWDAARRSELRVSTIRNLGLLLNLVVPGLGAVWATAGSGAALKRKFYWTGVLAVLGGLVWLGYGLLLGCVILFHGWFPPFTWDDLFGYPGGVVPGFFPDLAIFGSAFVLTSLPVFFLENRKSNTEGEEGEKNVTDQ